MAGKVIRVEGGLWTKISAAMSYLGILCFVPLLLNQHDEFVRFHARQGLVLWMWGVVAIFTLSIPPIGAWFFSSSGMIIMLLSAIGLVAVVLEKAWKLPLIYDIAERL